MFSYACLEGSGGFTNIRGITASALKLVDNACPKHLRYGILSGETFGNIVRRENYDKLTTLTILFIDNTYYIEHDFHHCKYLAIS